MKPYIIIGLVSSVLLIAGCNQKESTNAKESAAKSTTKEVQLNTLEQKVSYLFGFDMGQRLKGNEMELDLAALSQAINDVKEGRDPRLSKEEVQDVMKTYQEQSRAKQAEARKAAADANKKAGEEFLAANAKKEGVVTTESGLQYKVITEGKGPSPSLDDKVSVHYRGTLVDGTEFDSSYSRGEPVSFPVKGVIPGWTEALQLMKEGAKWELYIPSDLAYGPGGTAGTIGPNAALVFEVELLKAKADEEEKKGSDKGQK